MLQTWGTLPIRVIWRSLFFHILYILITFLVLQYTSFPRIASLPVVFQSISMPLIYFVPPLQIYRPSLKGALNPSILRRSDKNESCSFPLVGNRDKGGLMQGTGYGDIEMWTVWSRSSDLSSLPSKLS